MLMTVLMLAMTAGPAYPAGFELHQSECASGGFDYFFFPEGTVIGKCWGCEAQPNVQDGRWRRDGAEIVVTMTREWLGLGRGDPIKGASVDHFASYAAVVRRIPEGKEVQRFGASAFSTPDREGCESVRRHDRTQDPHAFLRDFDGQFPETFQRVLDPAELRTRSATELRLMRNEIFARYGYAFRDPALLAHFKTQKSFWSHLVDVDAFLSDVEKRNVELLAAAERGIPTAPAR